MGWIEYIGFGIRIDEDAGKNESTATSASLIVTFAFAAGSARSEAGRSVTVPYNYPAFFSAGRQRVDRLQLDPLRYSRATGTQIGSATEESVPRIGSATPIPISGRGC